MIIFQQAKSLEGSLLLSIFHQQLFMGRVKLGIFGQTAKFRQPLCLFHSSIIDLKYKSTKQTVKILMRRLIMSRLI